MSTRLELLQSINNDFIAIRSAVALPNLTPIETPISAKEGKINPFSFSGCVDLVAGAWPLATPRQLVSFRYENPFFKLIMTRFEIMATFVQEAAGALFWVDGQNVGMRMLLNNINFLPTAINMLRKQGVGQTTDLWLHPTENWVNVINDRAEVRFGDIFSLQAYNATGRRVIYYIVFQGHYEKAD